MSPAVVQRDSAAAVAVDGTSGAADSAMQFLSKCRIVNSTDFARHRGPACHAVTAFVRVQDVTEAQPAGVTVHLCMLQQTTESILRGKENGVTILGT